MPVVRCGADQSIDGFVIQNFAKVGNGLRFFLHRSMDELGGGTGAVGVDVADIFDFASRSSGKVDCQRAASAQPHNTKHDFAVGIRLGSSAASGDGQARTGSTHGTLLEEVATVECGGHARAPGSSEGAGRDQVK